MQVYVCYALQFSKGLYTENLEQKKQFYTAWLSWLYFRFLQPIIHPTTHPTIQPPTHPIKFILTKNSLTLYPAFLG